MVSYYNPLAMYRQQQGGQYGQNGTPTWYPQHPQQYLPTCMGDADPHSHPAPWTDKYHPAFHHEWTSQDCAHFQPSPPISEVSSPGAEGMSPAGSMSLQRPVGSRSPYEWMKKPSYTSQHNPGKTRTKDKYRVVYTDHQRLELEKEFHYSRYITIRRKAELAATLGLSERQVKIWFQNRRAKERKQVKKREDTQNKIKQEMEPLSASVVPAGMPGLTPLSHLSGPPSMHVGMPLM